MRATFDCEASPLSARTKCRDIIKSDAVEHVDRPVSGRDNVLAPAPVLPADPSGSVRSMGPTAPPTSPERSARRSFACALRPKDRIAKGSWTTLEAAAPGEQAGRWTENAALTGGHATRLLAGPSHRGEIGIARRSSRTVAVAHAGAAHRTGLGTRVGRHGCVDALSVRCCGVVGRSVRCCGVVGRSVRYRGVVGRSVYKRSVRRCCIGRDGILNSRIERSVSLRSGNIGTRSGIQF